MIAVGGALKWGLVAAASTPSPNPTRLRPGLTADQVSPGFAGFIAIFAVALAAVGLFFGLTRQLRRMRHNAEHAARADALVGASGGQAPDAPGASDGSSGDRAGPGDGGRP